MTTLRCKKTAGSVLKTRKYKEIVQQTGWDWRQQLFASKLWLSTRKAGRSLGRKVTTQLKETRGFLSVRFSGAVASSKCWLRHSLRSRPLVSLALLKQISTFRGEMCDEWFRCGSCTGSTQQPQCWWVVSSWNVTTQCLGALGFEALSEGLKVGFWCRKNGVSFNTKMFF